MLWWMLWLWVAGAWADDRDAFEAWVERLPEPEAVPAVAAGYTFTEDLWREVAAAVGDRPGLVEVERIGITIGRRPIWAFHVREPTTPVQRRVLIFAGIHALEWISSEVAREALLERIRRPEPGTEVTVIPLLNPDGRWRVERDLRQGHNLYRRGNLDNVDLNRDWGVHREARAIWRGIIPGYYATSPAPLSQPETQALDALAARQCYARAASLHAFGGFFYYPWTGRWERPPDHKAFMELGRAMEDAQGSHAYKTRQLSRWGFFFRAQGTEIDHLYGRYGTHAYLVELTRSGLNPFEPKTFGTKFRWYNPKNPKRHVARGVRAMRELVTHPALPGEPVDMTCEPSLVVSSP